METNEVKEFIEINRFDVLGLECRIVEWSEFLWVCVKLTEDSALQGREYPPTAMNPYVNFMGHKLPWEETAEDGEWWVCAKEPTKFIQLFERSGYLENLIDTLIYLVVRYSDPNVSW